LPNDPDGERDVYKSMLPLIEKNLSPSCRELSMLTFGGDGSGLEEVRKRKSEIAEGYDDVRTRFLHVHEELRKRPRSEALKAVEEMLPYALAGVAFPPWLGTEWNFYGASKKPGEGSIACGYFVAATLYAVGLNVKITLETGDKRHYRLVGSTSEEIIKNLVSPSSIKRFSNRPLSEVVDKVKEVGSGIYVIGLDCHVAFLAYEKDEPVWLWRSKPNHEVRLEKPEDDPLVARSRYRIIGKLALRTAEMWLDGKPIR